MTAIKHVDIFTEKGGLGMWGTTVNYQIAPKPLTLWRFQLEGKL